LPHFTIFFVQSDEAIISILLDFRLKGTEAAAEALEDGEKTVCEYANELYEQDAMPDNRQDLEQQRAVLQVMKLVVQIVLVELNKKTLMFK